MKNLASRMNSIEAEEIGVAKAAAVVADAALGTEEAEEVVEIEVPGTPEIEIGSRQLRLNSSRRGDKLIQIKRFWKILEGV